MKSTRIDWLASLFGLGLLIYCCCAELPAPGKVAPPTVDCGEVCAHLKAAGCIEADTAICQITCAERPEAIKANCLRFAPNADAIDACGTITCTLR